MTNQMLWLISQTTNTKYDTYDSAVVAASTEEIARNTHPSGDQSDFVSHWARTWVPANEVTVEYLGTTERCLKDGEIVLSSFNAG